MLEHLLSASETARRLAVSLRQMIAAAAEGGEQQVPAGPEGRRTGLALGLTGAPPVG